MSKNTLPPELVEKMRKAMNEMCTPSDLAKIAVDYAHKYKERLKVEMDVSVDFQKQRDELLEALRRVVKAGKEFNSHYGGSESLSTELHKSEQLLKKHNDGKE